MRFISFLSLCSLFVFSGCYSTPVCYDTASCNPGGVRGIKGVGGPDRDLISTLGESQQEKVKRVSGSIQSKYSLSAEVSSKIAKTVIDWNSLKDKTQSDLADFSKRLYGVEASDISDALMLASQGEDEKFNELIDEVASSWQSNPETIKNLIYDFHGKELNALGL